MWKFAALTSITLSALSINVAHAAHLALDHVKKDLESRFNDVKSSEDLHPAEKAKALSELRILQSRYSTALSHSVIPSQKAHAESEAQRLSRELQTFDRKLSQAKLQSMRNKRATDEPSGENGETTKEE